MSRKEKKRVDGDKEEHGISRREFLRDAGILAGGAAMGSTILLAACGGEEGVTTTTKTVTSTIPGTTETVTTTAGAGETVTTTLPGTTITVTEALPGEAVPGLVTLTVNGRDYTLKVEPDWTLAFVLRNKLLMPGTKVGCDRGECGTCTVVVDGRSVYSCMMLAIEAEGKDILTIDGLSDGITLHPIQQAFADIRAGQCGYCTPGFIMSAKAMLDKNSNPTRDEVREGLSGHVCPCGNSKRIVQAVLDVQGG